MGNQSSGGSGVGFFGALFLVFLVLKLMNVIDWSWWWVTAPLWIPPLVLIPIAGAMILTRDRR